MRNIKHLKSRLKESVKGQPFEKYELEDNCAKDVMDLQNKAEQINKLLANNLELNDKDFIINYHDYGLWIQFVDDINDDYDYGILVDATKTHRDKKISVDSMVNHNHKNWKDISEDANADQIVDAIIAVLEKDNRID